MRARTFVRLAILALVVVCGGAAVLVALSPSRTPVQRTAHLAFSVTVAPDAVAPGSRTSIVIDVSPRHGMHVYAPGTSYRPLTVALDSQPSIRIHDAVYPPPTPYVFEPLNETVLVYQAPFRVVRDITVDETEATRTVTPEHARIVIRGHLEYQACNATVCYLPESVPFERIIRIVDDGAGEVPLQTRK